METNHIQFYENLVNIQHIRHLLITNTLFFVRSVREMFFVQQKQQCKCNTSPESETHLCGLCIIIAYYFNAQLSKSSCKLTIGSN